MNDDETARRYGQCILVPPPSTGQVAVPSDALARDTLLDIARVLGTKATEAQQHGAELRA